MDSDFELVDSDGDFEAASISSDEPLVVLSSDDEDALLTSASRGVRKSEDILSPLATRGARNAKKRLREDTSQPPKPSGWVVANRRGTTVYMDDEEPFTAKRPKLADLVESRRQAQSKLAASTSSSSTVNARSNDDDVGELSDFSDDLAPLTLPNHSRLRRGGVASSKPVAKANAAFGKVKGVVVIDSDDDIFLSDVEPKGRGNTNSSHHQTTNKTTNGGTANGSQEDVVEASQPEMEEDEAFSDFEEHESGELDEFEADSVKYERVVKAAQKISTKLLRNLESNSTVPDGVVASSLVYAKPINAIIKQPVEIERQLKDYQVVGLNYLRILHLSSVNGILADEMGLGKTIQTIAMIVWLKACRLKYLEKGGKGTKPKSVNASIKDPSRDYLSFSDGHCDWPFLVVAPASTLANWKREFETWAPHLNVQVFHGSKVDREDLKDYIKLYWKRNKQHSFDVMISTYQTVSGKSDSSFFKHGIRFQYLIVDEAQMLKGKNTMRFTHLTQIRAVRRLMLTGTPLQNNLDELQALAAFLMPDLFGKLLEVTLQNELSALRAQGKKVHEIEYVNSLKQLLNPFILRRLKSQVGLGLLPKIHTTIDVAPTAIQAQINQKLFSRSRIVLRSNPPAVAAPSVVHDLTGDDSSESGVEDLRSTGSTTTKAEISQEPTDPNFMLANLLMQLRKSANHPVFIRAFYTPEQLNEIATVLLEKKHKKFKNYTMAEILNDLVLSSDWTLHNLCMEYPASLKHLWLPDEKLFDSSGKIVALSQLLPRLKAEGHRVVLFSQFTTVLDMLEQYLTRRMGYGYVRMDGSTKVSDRQIRMDAFNENRNDQYFIFMASTLSGGLGVNLTSADTVIFFDISFNPHVDRQAEDRCHRLGQTKQVTVYNLIMPGTVEEHMRRMAITKTELNDVMLNEGSFAENEALDAFNSAESTTADTTTLNPLDADDEAHPAYHIRRSSAELMFMQQVASSISKEP